MGNTHGLAITSLVLGIIGLIFCWVPILGQLLLIGAIICGAIGLHKIKTDNTLEGKGMAIAGISVFAFIGMMAYFGVLSPNNFIPERTTFKAPLVNMDNAVLNTATNSFEIAFRNNKGVPITIPLTTVVTSEQCINPQLSGMYEDISLTPDTPIPNGDNFILKWTCDQSRDAKKGNDFKADVEFDFVDTETGLTLKEMGNVISVYK